VQKPSSDCPLTPCIKLLAGAWTLEIIYYLHNGTQRFGQLRRLIGSVSSKVLSARLQQLEQRSIIARTTTPGSSAIVEYSLTPMGQMLLPVIDTFSHVSQQLRDKYPQIALPANSQKPTK